jgi:hypothetical protein
LHLPQRRRFVVSRFVFFFPPTDNGGDGSGGCDESVDGTRDGDVIRARTRVVVGCWMNDKWKSGPPPWVENPVYISIIPIARAARPPTTRRPGLARRPAPPWRQRPTVLPVARESILGRRTAAAVAAAAKPPPPNRGPKVMALWHTRPTVGVTYTDLRGPHVYRHHCYYD